VVGLEGGGPTEKHFQGAGNVGREKGHEVVQRRNPSGGGPKKKGGVDNESLTGGGRKGQDSGITRAGFFTANITEPAWGKKGPGWYTAQKKKNLLGGGSRWCRVQA